MLFILQIVAIAHLCSIVSSIFDNSSFRANQTLQFALNLKAELIEETIVRVRKMKTHRSRWFRFTTIINVKIQFRLHIDKLLEYLKFYFHHCHKINISEQNPLFKKPCYHLIIAAFLRCWLALLFGSLRVVKITVNIRIVF